MPLPVTFPDLPDLLTERGIEPRGVVHVGAHKGGEIPVYRACRFETIRLVEPIPALAARLRTAPGVDVVEAACAARGGTRNFNVASMRSWSSLLDVPANQSTVPGRRIDVTETIKVKVVRLATIQDGCNVAVIDAQGAEADVLEGADLERLELVIVETVTPSDVWRPALPRDAADEWFAARGWSPVREWTHRAPDVRDVAYAPASS